MLALLLASCTANPQNPDSWLADEYFQRLPNDPQLAYTTHVRAGVGQEYGSGTFLDQYSNAQIIELAALWCSTDRSRFSSVIGDELQDRNVDLNPGRTILPPPPIDVILTRIAYKHEATLCLAI